MKRVPFFVLMTGILLLLAAAGLTYLSSKPQGTAMARRPLQEVTAYTSRHYLKHMKKSIIFE